MSGRPCKRCGRDLIFAINRMTGKSIPLDAKAHVYRVIGGDALACKNEGAEAGYYVSHFFTCPHANEFSGARKPETPPEEVQP